MTVLLQSRHYQALENTERDALEYVAEYVEKDILEDAADEAFKDTFEVEKSTPHRLLVLKVNTVC